MPELTHDAEDGFHEIQLSGKQVVFLFMATTVVFVMIFLCGVLVGRGVRAERGGEADSPITEGAPSGSPAPASSMTTSAAPSASAEAPAPPAQDELSYQKELTGKNKPAETLKPRAEPQKPAASAAQPEPAAPQVKAAASPQTPPAADVPISGRSGAWVLQVSAMKNRDAASTIVRRLVSKGYPAFLALPPAGSPQMFRVQIGKYADRRDAEQIARRLEKEEQLTAVIKR